ncbi:uncharacterized protein [Lepeophtheirus salmonis]|uniref:uncharacterized protein n=1 Tax=Lepeophtheirus salmonis TaxID=72036 RepID=UPI001AEAA2D0|nr:uncharacterized protein LOC121126691 [Lepeophtheirus salmonis]
MDQMKIKTYTLFIFFTGITNVCCGPDFVRPNSLPNRQGKQLNDVDVPGGIDFSNAVLDQETGKRCVIKEDSIDSLEKRPILECTHKNVEKCHYTYVTQFDPSQEKVCEENFEKVCQITFKKQAQEETVKKCYKPLKKVCNGQGEEQCRTVYESSCSTKYVEKQPGKFVGDTRCQKLPIKICGRGCITQEGKEECHDKKIVTMTDIPEEICDLNPQRTCSRQTKLVPKLKPEHECTIVPQEVCNIKFTPPTIQKKALKTKWCLDDSPVIPGETYDEANALGSPIRRGRSGILDPIYSSNYQPESFNFPTQEFAQFKDVSEV